MRKIDLKDADYIGDLFDRLGKEWALVTAGTPEKCNTLTVSWGGFGVLWARNVATIYIRPERYTYEFVEREDYFTVSFFGSEFKKALALCGSKSGRDIDKVKECGFTVKSGSEGGVYFDEAQLVLVCRKRYSQDLNTDYLQGIDPDQYYGEHGGVHRMYIGEIIEVFAR